MMVSNLARQRRRPWLILLALAALAAADAVVCSAQQPDPVSHAAMPVPFIIELANPATFHYGPMTREALAAAPKDKRCFAEAAERFTKMVEQVYGDRVKGTVLAIGTRADQAPVTPAAIHLTLMLPPADRDRVEKDLQTYLKVACSLAPTVQQFLEAHPETAPAPYAVGIVAGSFTLMDPAHARRQAAAVDAVSGLRDGETIRFSPTAARSAIIAEDDDLQWTVDYHLHQDKVPALQKFLDDCYYRPANLQQSKMRINFDTFFCTEEALRQAVVDNGQSLREDYGEYLAVKIDDLGNRYAVYRLHRRKVARLVQHIKTYDDPGKAVSITAQIFKTTANFAKELTVDLDELTWSMGDVGASLTMSPSNAVTNPTLSFSLTDSDFRLRIAAAQTDGEAENLTTLNQKMYERYQKPQIISSVTSIPVQVIGANETVGIEEVTATTMLSLSDPRVIISDPNYTTGMQQLNDAVIAWQKGPCQQMTRELAELEKELLDRAPNSDQGTYAMKRRRLEIQRTLAHQEREFRRAAEELAGKHVKVLFTYELQVSDYQIRELSSGLQAPEIGEIRTSGVIEVPHGRTVVLAGLRNFLKSVISSRPPIPVARDILGGTRIERTNSEILFVVRAAVQGEDTDRVVAANYPAVYAVIMNAQHQVEFPWKDISPPQRDWLRQARWRAKRKVADRYELEEMVRIWKRHIRNPIIDSREIFDRAIWLDLSCMEEVIQNMSSFTGHLNYRQRMDNALDEVNNVLPSLHGCDDPADQIATEELLAVVRLLGEVGAVEETRVDWFKHGKLYKFTFGFGRCTEKEALVQFMRDYYYREAPGNRQL